VLGAAAVQLLVSRSQPDTRLRAARRVASPLCSALHVGSICCYVTNPDCSTGQIFVYARVSKQMTG
jgi:hypothetical protein